MTTITNYSAAIIFGNSLKANKWLYEKKKHQVNNVGRSCRQITCNLELPIRRSANYQPSLWGNDYLQSLPSYSYEEEEMNRERIRVLKKEVMQLIDENKDVKSQLELIDELEQLGVAYHFKDQIHNVLWEISNISSQNISMALKDDLSATSVLFRLLRQNGFDVTQDLFINYKNKKGDFGQDIKGIINLYEASYLAKYGESVMDEARISTTKQLQKLIAESSQIDPHTKDHIEYALELPLDRRVTRLHNRWYIEAHQKKQSINPNLLELAKLDYNAVQMIFKHELKNASRWWTELGLVEALPFSRDRLVENYFMSVGFSSEPHQQNLREATMKVNCFVTAIDDIYDVHGTIDELELFTSVINSWDVNDIHQLPEYMKICFMALLDTINDAADKVMKLKGLDITPHLKRAWADICNSYLVEARWYHNGHKPKFEEYLNNAWITISGGLLFMHGYCTNEHITHRNLQSFSYPNIAVWSSTITRLCDDLATSKDELERGDVLKSIQCYMHGNDVSEVIARRRIKEIINDYWKKINTIRSYISPHQQFYNDVAINIARMAHCIYQYGDGYAKPNGRMKYRITSVLMDPIII